MGLKLSWDKLLSDVRIRSFYNGTKPKPKSRPYDPRTEFERDYGRAVFCTPVRRLQDKTQVFPLEPHDAVRTRLTHSLEVSSVARGIARGIGDWLMKTEYLDHKNVAAIETIAATCGLIHDLGNPPFGHAGELAIQEWFQNHADEVFQGPPGDHDFAEDSQCRRDFLGFDGNAQTIRLVSRLQVLADPHGLNLTCGTLSAARKYTASSDKIDKGKHEKSKAGHFASENDVIKHVSDKTETGDMRNPIAFIVEAADDICYSTVDLEDAVKKGVLDWPRLKKLLSDNCEDKQELDKCISDAKEYIDSRKELWPKKLRRIPDDAYAQMLRTTIIARMVPAVIDTFCGNYEAIMSGDYHHELAEDCSASAIINACKQVGRDHVYCAKPNVRLEVMGRHIIHELMDIFWEAAREAPDSSSKKFPGKIYELMSSNYRNIFESTLQDKNNMLPKRYCQAQLVTDYVSGMTDTFARETHKRLTNG